MGKLVTLLTLIFVPIFSFAGGEGTWPGIVQKASFSSESGSLTLAGGEGVGPGIIHAVKYLESNGVTVKFHALTKNGLQKLDVEESTLESQSPELLDAIEHSFSSNNEWVEI